MECRTGSSQVLANLIALQVSPTEFSAVNSDWLVVGVWRHQQAFPGAWLGGGHDDARAITAVWSSAAAAILIAAAVDFSCDAAAASLVSVGVGRGVRALMLSRSVSGCGWGLRPKLKSIDFQK